MMSSKPGAWSTLRHTAEKDQAEQGHNPFLKASALVTLLYRLGGVGLSHSPGSMNLSSATKLISLYILSLATLLQNKQTKKPNLCLVFYTAVNI